jgi:methylmalonyl-CoA mutase C-terminal domain/subunit
MKEKIRVLISKVGLDGHDVGAKLVAKALRDAGMEVLYAGLRRTPEEIVNIAIQEDVDAIGISILSGAHMTFFPLILQLLEEKGACEIMLFGGGVIPLSDVKELKRLGVRELFRAGTNTAEIIEFVRREIGEKKKEKNFTAEPAENVPLRAGLNHSKE